MLSLGFSPCSSVPSVVKGFGSGVSGMRELNTSAGAALLWRCSITYGGRLIQMVYQWLRRLLEALLCKTLESKL
jgi:hypothetical protein